MDLLRRHAATSTQIVAMSVAASGLASVRAARAIGEHAHAIGEQQFEDLAQALGRRLGFGQQQLRASGDRAAMHCASGGRPRRTRKRHEHRADAGREPARRARQCARAARQRGRAHAYADSHVVDERLDARVDGGLRIRGARAVGELRAALVPYLRTPLRRHRGERLRHAGALSAAAPWLPPRTSRRGGPSRAASRSSGSGTRVISPRTGLPIHAPPLSASRNPQSFFFANRERMRFVAPGMLFCSCTTTGTPRSAMRKAAQASRETTAHRQHAARARHADQLPTRRSVHAKSSAARRTVPRGPCRARPRSRSSRSQCQPVARVVSPDRRCCRARAPARRARAAPARPRCRGKCDRPCRQP